MPVTDPDPIPLLKQQIARELVARLEGWTQDYAASFIGADPSRVSNLRNGLLTCFSLERLIRFVARTKGEVTLDVTWTPCFLYCLPARGAPTPTGVARTARAPGR